MEQSLSQNRLKWACRRGMLELDVLLGDFLDNGYAELNAGQRDDFEVLLLYPDQDLYDYFMRKRSPNNKKMEQLIDTIRRTAHSKIEKIE